VSYILEALKKAEAQRGQGQVPGLHDQHMAPEFSGGGARDGNGLLIWIIMGMGVVMMGLLVWALWQPEGTPAAPVAHVAISPAPAALPAPTLPPVQAIQPPTSEMPAAQGQPTSQVAQVLASATTAPPTQPSPQPRNERRPRNEPTKPEPAAKAQTEALPELPEAMRAQLPKLSFGGAMHSDNPASRMLIVNGQLLHEGDAISPELSLEQIHLKQATFRYKGYRYTVQY
jgi:general secretion pathway protein B